MNMLARSARAVTPTRADGRTKLRPGDEPRGVDRNLVNQDLKNIMERRAS
jgi:hypothetical protein